MFEEKELNFKIDTKELQQKIEKAIVEDIENAIYKSVYQEYKFSDRYNFERSIINLFKRAISEFADKASKEIRKEVKEEVIERAVDKLMLDKNEVLKKIFKS